MSNVFNDGGSAFPHRKVNLDEAGFEYIPESSGMSLRDWFAGQALACLADPACADPCNVSEFCYKVADAMMAERNKK